MTLYTLALELTIVLATWLAIAAWQRDDHVPGRLTYAFACLAVIAWCAGDLVAYRDEAYITAVRVRCLGILSLPSLWVGVAAHAAKLDLIRRTPWLPWGLMAPGIVPFALLFAGPWSVLFIPAVDAPQVEVGPLFWVFLAYGSALGLAGAAILIRSIWTAGSPEERDQRVRLTVAAMIPVGLSAGAIVPMLVRTGQTTFDPTPIFIGGTLIFFRRAILSGGLLDVLPFAQRDIIRHLPFGVVLADGRGTVLDVNPAGEALLGTPRSEAVGRALEAVIARAPLTLRIEVSTVERRRGPLARFALIEAPKAPGS